MQGYVALKKKKNNLGKTLTTVAVIHLIIGGGLIWLAYSQVGHDLMTVYKLNLRNIYEPPPPPPPPEVMAPEPEPPPEVEEPKPPEPEIPVQEAKVPELLPPVEPPPSTGESPQIKLPGFGNPFGGGGKSKFGGYADLVTVEIHRLYKQPADLPEDKNLAVQLQIFLNDDGGVLNYKLVKSSGNEKFDQSALEALARLHQLSPPPAGMSRTLIIKFYQKFYTS
ncbi:MAG: energy transducer TonB [Nitrospiria bacterium]